MIFRFKSTQGNHQAKVAVAKAQERVNQVGSSLKGVSNNMSAFDRMEEKANKMLDTANAMAQLNESANTNVDDLLVSMILMMWQVHLILMMN